MFAKGERIEGPAKRNAGKQVFERSVKLKNRGDTHMPYTYILECADKSYYTGSTWNLEQRLCDHENGQGAKYTKNRLPVKLVYWEEYERIKDAFSREHQIKGWTRAKKQALIFDKYESLPQLAKKCFR